jgi:hypothetical protein
LLAAILSTLLTFHCLLLLLLLLPLLLLCRLLLGCECRYLTDVVKPRLELLAAGLPGADIAAMVQEDPCLLFEELESSGCYDIDLLQCA